LESKTKETKVERERVCTTRKMTGESLILDPTGGGDVDVQGRMKVGRVRERQLVSALRAGGRERGGRKAALAKPRFIRCSCGNCVSVDREGSCRSTRYQVSVRSRVGCWIV
jgi:hypothetical protein